MTQQHPITPPPELVGQWLCSEDYEWDPLKQASITITTNRLQNVATQAAQWGADQELEACCEWLRKDDDAYQLVGLRAVYLDHELHAARRPKPPSLKEQALGALSRADKNALTNPLTGEVVALRAILSKEQSDTIRRALNELPDN